MWVNMNIKFLFFALLTLRFGFCSDELKFEVKTVTVGQNVTLSCPRQISALYRETFYWIRLVSGNWPEFLGAAVNFKIDDVSKIPHIQTKQEEGEYHLHINEAKRNDTGLYYCIKVKQLEFIFINGTFLKIRGQKLDIIDVILDRPSGSVNAENSDTLQCSVLSDSEKKTCPADNRVYWFKAGSDHSHPSLLYLQENNGDECENSPEAQTAQKCFYNFSGTSDSGIHHCAVAACGQILFGNGLDSQESSSWSLEVIVILLLCTVLIISLMVIAFLAYIIINMKCDSCQDGVVLHKHWSQERQKGPRDKWIYSSVIFTVMNQDSGPINTSAQRKRIYATMKAFGS